MLDMADLNIAEDFNQRRSFIRKEIKRTNKIMEKVIGKFGIPNNPAHTNLLHITTPCLYNIDSIKPHFYIVKLGFTGVYFIFSYFCSKT